MSALIAAIVKALGPNLMLFILGVGYAVLFPVFDPYKINLIAFAAAVAGAGARWLWFRLMLRDGFTGLIVSPVAAALCAYFHPPILDTFIGAMSPENYASILGFVLGMFPAAVGGWIQDVLISLRKSREEKP